MVYIVIGDGVEEEQGAKKVTAVCDFSRLGGSQAAFRWPWHSMRWHLGLCLCFVKYVVSMSSGKLYKPVDNYVPPSSPDVS